MPILVITFFVFVVFLFFGFFWFLEEGFEFIEAEPNEELSEKVGAMVRGETDWVTHGSLTNGVAFYRHIGDNCSGEMLHIYGEQSGVVEMRPVYGYFSSYKPMKFYDKALSSEIRKLSEKLERKGIEEFCKKL